MHFKKKLLLLNFVFVLFPVAVVLVEQLACVLGKELHISTVLAITFSTL